MKMVCGGGWSRWVIRVSGNLLVKHGSWGHPLPPTDSPASSSRGLEPRPGERPVLHKPSWVGRASSAACWHIEGESTASLSFTFCSGHRLGRLRTRAHGFRPVDPGL